MTNIKEKVLMSISIFSLVVLATWTGATIFKPVSAENQVSVTAHASPFAVSNSEVKLGQMPIPDPNSFVASANYYLQIDGIDGEVTDKQCPKCIEINSFSWGLSNPTTIGSSTGGAGAGKVSFSDINFMHKVDKASPILMQSLATGRHIPKATLYVRKSGGDPKEYMKIVLEDVIISSYSVGGATDNVPTDSISINFAKIQFVVKGSDVSTGGVIVPVVGGN